MEAFRREGSNPVQGEQEPAKDVEMLSYHQTS